MNVQQRVETRRLLSETVRMEAIAKAFRKVMLSTAAEAGGRVDDTDIYAKVSPLSENDFDFVIAFGCRSALARFQTYYGRTAHSTAALGRYCLYVNKSGPPVSDRYDLEPFFKIELDPNEEYIIGDSNFPAFPNQANIAHDRGNVITHVAAALHERLTEV